MNDNIEQIITQGVNSRIEESVIFYNNEIYTYWDSGLTRYVFVNEDKTKVVKLLIESKTHDYNKEEFEIYVNASDEKKKELAKTTLGINGLFIEQEFCNPIKLDARKLNIPQMLFERKCRNEVGWTADGNLVCFDLDEYKKW